MTIWGRMFRRVVPGLVYFPTVRVWRRLLATGLSHFCPLCRSHLSRFDPYGQPARLRALCPNCGSLERHRLVWRYFQSRTDLFDGEPKRLLHVAPEPQIAALLARVPAMNYLSIDLAEGAAMARMDLTDLDLPDDSFDVIYCSHVLEHVPDDRRAMRELYRVLRPDGWAVLHVPILRETTFEDSSVTTPEDRERVFGQCDHVRIYGRDYVDRLREAGFDVCEDSLAEQSDPHAATYYGLCPDEPIHFCCKGQIMRRKSASETYQRLRIASKRSKPSIDARAVDSP